MTIAELGSLGEFIASLGVLITLIYLAIQMRQNTKAVRLNTAHAVTEEFQEIFSLLASDQGLSEVFMEAAQNAELSGLSRLRYNTFIGSTLRAYENAYLQNREQAINADHWAGLTRMMIDVTAMPAFPNYWTDRKHWHSNGFQVHMDTNIVPVPAESGVSMPGNYSKNQN
jgi:hypothetical protein